MSKALLGKTQDGRVFPLHGEELLSWSIDYTSPIDELQGFPRMRTVIRAMREHRPDQLRAEYVDCLRGMRGMFGGSRMIMRILLEECPFLLESC